jgi:membrane protease YdiL (CAAX protease family)
LNSISYKAQTMVFSIKSVQNFILFLSIFSILYLFSMETFLDVDSATGFPLITVLMSTLISILIITDLRLRGLYFSEILEMLKPQPISMNQFALTFYISTILCGILVLTKFIILEYFLYAFPFSSNHIELFSPKLLGLNSALLASIVVYTLTCIFQEFIARSWLQDSFSLIFSNKAIPIFMTAAYFGASHLHMTPYIACLVFVLSLGWGVLYTYTNRSLYSVVLSHALVGIFAFNILGVPFELVYGLQR